MTDTQPQAELVARTSAHEPRCPHPTLGRCNCRVSHLALALGAALKQSCVHLGECYANVDEQVAYDGDVAADVDGEISLMALAEAAFTHLASAPHPKPIRETAQND